MKIRAWILSIKLQWRLHKRRKMLRKQRLLESQGIDPIQISLPNELNEPME